MKNFYSRLFIPAVFLIISISGAWAQEKLISGTVKDESGGSMPGVNIIIKGTATGAATDADGKFTVSVSSNDAVLIFSFVGYTTQEVRVGALSTIDVSLVPDAISLQEVVVMGYGEQKKTSITGSVTTVKADAIRQSPVANLSNALVGRMPGIVFVNRSGEPGNDGSLIRVRGSNTIGNTGALIVIDGIANRSGGLDRINPADVESITVLKDASAAIYGAQAANGVILVTTKRGKTGKPELSLNYNMGLNQPARLPKVGDAVTYATMLNEIDEYRGRAPRYSATDFQKFASGSDPWTHPNTDWYGAVIKPSSFQDNLNLSLSGGNADGVSYYVSLGSLTEDGVYKNSGTKYKQYNFRANVDAKVTKYFKIGFDVAGRQENRNYPTRSAGTIFRMLMRGKPNLPAYWPNGLPGPDIENGDNPVVTSTTQTGSVVDNNYVFQSNIRGVLEIPWVKGLSLTMNAAFDESFRPVKSFATPWYLYTWDYATYVNGEPLLAKSLRGLSAPQLTESFTKYHGSTQNARFDYTKQFGIHSIGIMVGAEKQVIKENFFTAFRNSYLSAAVPQLSAGGDNLNKNNSGGAFETARMNYFGRLNYNMSEKYLVEMVWRYDASYLFPEDSRWGFFPGVSAGWVMSEEGFMKGISAINRLKIRGSWGQLGNDRFSASGNIRDDQFNYLSLFQQGGGYVFNETSLNTSVTNTLVPNPSFTWEIASNSNIGFEGTLFNGKISFEMDYFSNNRSQMLVGRSAAIPASAGFITLPPENAGKLTNNGFDFMLGYNGKAGDLSFNVGVNGGYSRNKIVYFGEREGIDPWQTATGRPLGSSLMYEAIGVFKDAAQVAATVAKWPGARPGDIIFKDVNGDNVINGLDRVMQEENNIPRFQGGITLGGNYKGFDVAILIQGATGAKQYIRTQSGDFGNYLTDFSDGRWTTENPSSTKPRTFNREDEYWVSQANTFWYRNTDYLRLKNIQIGYNLSSDLVKKVGLKSARVYTNGINLITLDSFKVFDPESSAQDGTYYPQLRIYNVGVNLTF